MSTSSTPPSYLHFYFFPRSTPTLFPLQKGAGLQETDSQTGYNKTRWKSSYQGWTTHPNRRKRGSRAKSCFYQTKPIKSAHETPMAHTSFLSHILGWQKTPTGPPGDMMINKCLVGKWERETGACAVERDRADEGKVVRNRLMWVACLPPGAVVTSRSELLPKATSGSVVLPQPEALTSIAHVVSKGHTEAQVLGRHLWLCWCRRDVLMQRPC